jgi:hypothetical protein
MDLCKIDGKTYDVIITAIQETSTVEEGGNKGTALYRQRDIPDVAGIRYAHKITFSPNDEAPELFDELYSYLFDNVRESVQLEAVHNQTTVVYEARYSVGSRNVTHINERTEFVGWDELTIDFRSIEINVVKNT